MGPPPPPPLKQHENLKFLECENAKKKIEKGHCMR